MNRVVLWQCLVFPNLGHGLLAYGMPGNIFARRCESVSHHGDPVADFEPGENIKDWPAIFPGIQIFCFIAGTLRANILPHVSDSGGGAFVW